MTYQEKLNSYNSLYDGIKFEMENTANMTINNMLNWDYDNPRILELKYENIMVNPKNEFMKLFKHYGFDNNKINIYTEQALECTIKPKDSLENENFMKSNLHVRSGKICQWKEFYNEELIQLYESYFSQAHIKLGYKDWDEQTNFDSFPS